MSDLTFKHFSEVNKRRCINGFNQPIESWTPADWTLAAMGEFGELANCLKKLKRMEDGIDEFDESKYQELMINIQHEMADVITYLDLLSTRLNINLEQCLIEKFNIVSDRRGSDIKL